MLFNQAKTAFDWFPKTRKKGKYESNQAVFIPNSGVLSCLWLAEPWIIISGGLNRWERRAADGHKVPGACWGFPPEVRG